jgi:hypothetical protein
MNKKDQSFPTWSFDAPCLDIEWNDLNPVFLRVSSDLMSYEESDIVLLGIFGPDIGDDDDEDAKTAVVHLSGTSKEIDERLGGILTEVLVENQKSFKAGAIVGALTTTIRIPSPTGGKV